MGCLGGPFASVAGGTVAGVGRRKSESKVISLIARPNAVHQAGSPVAVEAAPREHLTQIEIGQIIVQDGVDPVRLPLDILTSKVPRGGGGGGMHGGG